MSVNYKKALELARDEQWKASHEMVQKGADPFSCLIHAYLHRVEGDDSNAAYWYQRAGEEFCQLSVDDELESLFRRCDANAQ